ncbi:hypothetical protein BN1058_02156 [Paraliobacillus sp. PM-2]|uniref:hypothetical protein n=1 Tax=Paraliobacillus sp. PM-2 TaxID=1462524 RepID=UPI00061C27DC|nr:hypothetical protein [Paraliobacillus sp. PM-2]CQR47825.1 hypothetical protein BN1058_02156 [Paraliobacillus sp. PM-2]
MRKNIIYTIVVGIILYFSMNKKMRDKGVTTIKKWIDVIRNSESFPIEEAGVPEVDNIENAKMVDEGSQFGVEYYNRIKEGE